MLKEERLVDPLDDMIDPRSSFSLMFSPANCNVLVVAGTYSVDLFDIRNLEEYFIKINWFTFLN